jgi:hypothetical protein
MSLMERNQPSKQVDSIQLKIMIRWMLATLSLPLYKQIKISL